MGLRTRGGPVPPLRRRVEPHAARRWAGCRIDFALRYDFENALMRRASPAPCSSASPVRWWMPSSRAPTRWAIASQTPPGRTDATARPRPDSAHAGTARPGCPFSRRTRSDDMAESPRLETLRGTRLATELSTDRQRRGARRSPDAARPQGRRRARAGRHDRQPPLRRSSRACSAWSRTAGTPEALTLHTLSAGDFVDELGFLDGTPYYASKVAIVRPHRTRPRPRAPGGHASRAPPSWSTA